MKAARRQARPARQVPTAPDRKLPPLESAGDWIRSNQWVGVGLSRAQVKILSLLGQHWRFKEAPTATAARMLLCVALDDLPRMERRLAAALRKTGWGGHELRWPAF